MLVKCDYCEKLHYKRPYLVRDFKHHFCSRECHHKWEQKNKKSVICKNCGEEFYIPAHRLKHRHHFCSNKCRTTWIDNKEYKNKEWLENNYSKGKSCTDIARDLNVSNCTIRRWLKKFDIKIRPAYVYHIGAKRSLETRNRIREAQKGMPLPKIQGKNHYRWKGGLQKCICPVCKKVFYRKKSQATGRRFCSKQCYGKGELRENNHMWKGGKTDTPYYYGVDWKEIRLKILERDKFKCRTCGRKKNLHVHHIVPFSEFDNYDEANDPSNLITLCGRCHRKFELHSDRNQVKLDFWRTTIISPQRV